MRIVSEKTLKVFYSEYPVSKQGLLEWNETTSRVIWRNPNELKKDYPSASIINSKRVVFNINGNKFRLIVDIEYALKIVFIVWIGTHAQYDKLNIKEVKYVRTN